MKKQSAKKDINILDLSSIFQSLSGAKRSGTLRVNRSEGTEDKLVYFRKGNVEAVTAPRKKLMLGEALIKYGSLTEEQLQEALQKQKGWKVDLGGALLKLGYVKEGDIRKALVFQITEEVCDVFAWPDVHCEFTPGEPPEAITKLSKDGVHVSVNPESLVMEAARRIDEWEILKEMLPSMKDVLVATPKAVHYYDEASGHEAELEALSCIDGVRDVSDIVEKARMSKFDALKTLYKLITAKEITPITPVQLVQLAFNCASTGQLEKCVRLYERAIEMGVTDLDLDIRLAETYEALGMGDKAIDMYVLHAEEAAKSGRVKEAINGYRKVVSLDKWRIEAHEKLIETLVANDLRDEAVKEAVRLAQKLLERKEESRAVSLWEEIKESMPDGTEPYRQLANLHANAGRTVQAIIELENLAGLYQVNSDPDMAVETFREMLRLDKECIQARLSVAATLAEMGQTEEAVTEYNALAETLSKSGVIHDSGNWTFLIDIYEKILDLEPNNIRAREWLAHAYIENNMVDKALPSLRQVAEAKRAEGRLTEVPDPLKQLVKLQPNDVETRMELAKVYLELGDIVHATEVYQEVIKMSLDNKEFGLAQRAAAKILNANPHDLVAHRALAEMYADVGEQDKQLAELRKVGWLSYCGGDFKAAVKSFEEILKLEPGALDISLALPAAYKSLGDKRKAFDCYLSLASECVLRNDLSLARWAGEKAAQIDGVSNKVDRILSQVDDKDMVLKKGGKLPVIERGGSKPPQPVIDKRNKEVKK
jgi:tetratricopeptide (TPR) repeat protein